MKVISPVRLLIATSNRHKLDELRELLGPSLPGVELLCGADFPHVPDPDEDGATFEANALIKARAYHAATGFTTLADDSGLVVDALAGRPGIHSARYAASPEARIQRVLTELTDAPPSERTARFVCVMAICGGASESPEVTRRGEVEGLITRAPRGAQGFGYDPVFELRDDGSPGVAECAGRTLAELSSGEKNEISHRGRAIAAILPLLRERLLGVM